jgi:hypothetical protein
VVQASASDNVGVASVSFYANGTLIGTDTTAPYSCAWDTTKIVNGSCTLTAKAVDAVGNSSTASIGVTVSNAAADSTPPAISSMTPSGGATVSGTVAVQTSATDNVGVTSVSFYVDGALKATDSTAPYGFSWDTTTAINGTHLLMAKASDAAGNTASLSCSVTVSNVSQAPADTTPPSVAFLSPASGASLTGTVAAQVSASDNVGVAYVRFYVDGALCGTAIAAPYTFSCNTSTLTDGTHALKAVALDAAGNLASAQINVTVRNSPDVTTTDTVAPTVIITSPTSGSSVNGVVSVSVNATDNVGVARVELYVDGNLTSSATTAPFTLKWNARKAWRGTHTLQCKAYDAAGNVGTSPEVTVQR